MKILALLSALLLGGSAVSAQAPCIESETENLEGRWIGVLPIEGALFELSLRFRRGDDGCLEGATSTGMAPGERRHTSLRVDGDRLEFRDERVFAFTGTIEDSSIVGVFDSSEGGAHVRFFRDGTREAEEILADLEEARQASRPAPLKLIEEGSAYDSVDRGALEGLIEGATGSNTHALAVLRNGELVGTWHAGGEISPSPLMSITKVVTGLAVGRLVTTGALRSIDLPVGAVFPEWASGERGDVTIRHLMTHTSGLRDGQPLDFYDDSYRFARQADLVERPGEEVRYNNNAVNLLAAVVAEVAGRPIEEFVAEELFEPLGISEFSWDLDRAGNAQGMTGLRMLPDDLAKLGQLVLWEGEWEGQQLISRTWIAQSITPQGDSGRTGLIWQFQWDEGEILGYHHSGALGQYLVVYPAGDIVGVRQIRPHSAYDRGVHGYRDFPDLLRALAVQ